MGLSCTLFLLLLVCLRYAIRRRGSRADDLDLFVDRLRTYVGEVSGYVSELSGRGFFTYGHAHDQHDVNLQQVESGLQGLSNNGQVYLEVINGGQMVQILWVHPTKYFFYVNSAKYKIFKNHKKYLEVLQFLKPKEKIWIDI